MRVFQIAGRGGGEFLRPTGAGGRGAGGLEILLEEEFITGWREPEEEWFLWFEPFLNLKTAFCEY